MNRIDRLTAILIQLQTKRVVKAQEIADRFNISLRTVYRDIRALEEAGIPIGSEAGLGYYLVEGYHLPPVMLDRDEAGALLISQKLVEKFADASIRDHLDSAMYKIRSVLNDTDKDYLQNLDHSIQVHNVMYRPNEGGSLQLMSKIQQAVSSKKKLKLNYSKLNQESSSRTVDPLGMIYYANAWHLIAWCNLREGYRDFRVDRITHLSVENERFFETDHLTLQEYIDQMENEHELVEVILEVDNFVLPYISVQKYYQGYISEEKGVNRTQMKFMVSDWEYFTRWLITLGNAVHPISPQALKDKMKNLAKEISDHFLSE